jgi:hypothetical protein
VHEAGSDHDECETGVRIPQRDIWTVQRGHRHVDRIMPRRPDETDEQARTGEAHEGMYSRDEKAPPADFLAGGTDDPDEGKHDQHDREQPYVAADGRRQSRLGEGLGELASVECIEREPDD